MKALQLTQKGCLALSLFLATLLMPTNSGAQTANLTPPISPTGDALERRPCAGVFEDAGTVCQSATSATSTSPGDDRIRWLTFYLIYTDDELSRYTPGGAMGARFDIFQFAGFPGSQPYGYPIHIVVTHGRTRLTGVVRTAREKLLAERRAREASGVLAVDNALIVADEEELR